MSNGYGEPEALAELSSLIAQLAVDVAEVSQRLVRLSALVGEWGLQRRRCPACQTALDADGYCTDVGCPNCGKAVPVPPSSAQDRP